jgi:4'-phosphopantetheinyl transferase
MINIYGTNIKKTNNISAVNQVFSFLSMEKQKRIKSFIHKEDALRTLTGEWIIRNIIREKLNIAEEKIIFDVNKYGKPYLKYHRNFHFNISHSGDWVVCATAAKPVGIDIELISPIDLNMAEHFFSQEEVFDLFSKREKERLSYFYELWTLKESFIKAAGKGLSIELHSFSIKKKVGNIELKSEIKEKYYFKQYDIDRKYKMSVCSNDNNFPADINYNYN